MLDLVDQHGGRLLVDWPIGVGKSSSIDQTIEAGVTSKRYDLVVALFPTRELINERGWILSPPKDYRVVNLLPRPRKRCGETLDQTWQQFETAAMGQLGRLDLCGGCPKRRGCYWPTQYGKHLEGTNVVFATQAQLERSPTFILQLIQWTNAQRTLTLLDEVNVFLKTFHQCIPKDELLRFYEVLIKLSHHKRGKHYRKWLDLTHLLLRASTEDLRFPDWKFPFLDAQWALEVQSLGQNLYQQNFHFLGHKLQHLGRSPLASRERAPNGDLLFASPPIIPGGYIIYSGSTHQDYTKFRLGQDIIAPFRNYVFKGPDTVWYNLASRLGTRTNFLRNSSQILDFFAGLIAKRVQEGHRPLLVAKKCFLEFSAREIDARLREMGLRNIHVLSNKWTAKKLARSSTIPLIHYGLIGSNLFEEFDAAYCLTGYYVTEKVVNQAVQDVLASDSFIPITIKTTTPPRRRKVEVRNPKHRQYDIQRLAQLALDHHEMGTVLQAVGRVRPYTKRREIITFQCAAHPQLSYTQEFCTLGEARQYFDIPSRRNKAKARTRTLVQAAKLAGSTQKKTATKLGVSVRTVKRYWANSKDATNPV